MEANKCYKCLYQRTIPGDMHSRCAHPKVREISQSDNEFELLGLLGAGRFKKAIMDLKIQGHSVGVNKGWFLWPANFDPVWLINCDGFTDKDKGQPQFVHV